MFGYVPRCNEVKTQVQLEDVHSHDTCSKVSTPTRDKKTFNRRVVYQGVPQRDLCSTILDLVQNAKYSAHSLKIPRRFWFE